MTIKLYDLCAADRDLRFSPACWRTRMALAHKGLEVETVATLFTEIGSIEGGGQKTVPVIEDAGAVVRNSFSIALYLEEKYPDSPSLFGGDGGQKMAHFIDRWADAFIDKQLVRFCLLDIYHKLDEQDQPYFRASREKRFGCALEEVGGRSPERLEAFRESLLPMRLALRDRKFLGGETPLYADYSIFGSFQWARMVSDFSLLEEDDPVATWFDRCLDLYDGLGRNAKV